MSLKEKVKELFDRQHALTNESLRCFDKGLARDDIEAEEKKISAKLQTILDESLKGDFKITKFDIEKDRATVQITNDVLVISCAVEYKKVGLSAFSRKPGAKQTMQRDC